MALTLTVSLVEVVVGGPSISSPTSSIVGGGVVEGAVDFTCLSPLLTTALIGITLVVKWVVVGLVG